MTSADTTMHQYASTTWPATAQGVGMQVHAQQALTNKSGDQEARSLSYSRCSFSRPGSRTTSWYASDGVHSCGGRPLREPKKSRRKSFSQAGEGRPPHKGALLAAKQVYSCETMASTDSSAKCQNSTCSSGSSELRESEAHHDPRKSCEKKGMELG